MPSPKTQAKALVILTVNQKILVLIPAKKSEQWFTLFDVVDAPQRVNLISSPSLTIVFPIIQ